MPSGLQGTPGVFQDMMEILRAKANQYLQELEVNSCDIFLSDLFDDSGLCTNSLEKHLMLIEKFLQTCLENNVRVKLSKSDFMVKNLTT